MPEPVVATRPRPVSDSPAVASPRERALVRHGGAPSEPRLVDLWRYRGLIGNFASRELKAKYRRSALGWAWSLINPIATIAIFTVVFSIIFRAQPPPLGDGRGGNYTLYLFTGLILWNFFSSVATGSMGALLAAGPLLKKIYFPAYVPVLGAMLAVLVQTAIETVVLVVVLLAIGNVSWTFLLAPLIFLPLILFSVGVGLVFALLNVHFRDVNYLVTIGLQMLFYATPIIYVVTQIPTGGTLGPVLRTLFSFNPLFQFVEAFRDCLYDLAVPSWHRWLAVLLAAFVTFAVGWWVFTRFGRDISEEL